MQMMSPYYAGGLGIPYMMGMGGMGESIMDVVKTASMLTIL